MEFTFSEIKQIRDLVGDDWRGVVEKLAEGESDVSDRRYNYRFIAADEIDSILEEELSGDLYILGCFHADFLANVTGIPREAIEAIQKAEAHEALGKLLESQGHVAEIARAYAAADGYGHHFSPYDSETIEINDDLYAFRCN